jgi:putative addiction module component (TIGR02574 family)
MSKHFTEIENDALALSEHDRALLVQRLLETLDNYQDEDVEASWLEEAEKRYAEYQAAMVKTVSADQAFSEARKRLK